jgi:hypothetical protein
MALAIALEEQAAGAVEIGANNAGPWVQKYLGDHGPAPQPWCAALVSWCFHEAARRLGVPPPFYYELNARALLRQLPLVDDPQPGDIVGWWRGSAEGTMGHVGIVRALSRIRILSTLEGNRGRFPVGIRTIGYLMDSPEFRERLLGFGRVC